MSRFHFIAAQIFKPDNELPNLSTVNMLFVCSGHFGLVTFLLQKYTATTIRQFSIMGRWTKGNNLEV